MKKCGWIDLQVNGFVEVDFSSPSLTEEKFVLAAEKLFVTGTEVFLPALITSPPEIYKRNAEIIFNAVRNRNWEKNVPGFHFEGPFISPVPGYVGAHPSEYVQESNIAFIEYFAPVLKILTVAPERPGVMELIPFAVEHGILVSLGHTAADSLLLRRAVDAGATLLTHLGNGITNTIDRHHNPIWDGMAEDRLIAMFIADGHHLPLEVIKCFKRCKSVEKLIVVSDAAPAAGLPPGKYIMGNEIAVLEENGLYHNPIRKCLAGSSATMQDCVDFLSESGMFSASEIEQMCRSNPAKVIGLG